MWFFIKTILQKKWVLSVKLFIFLSFFSAMNILLNHRFNYFSWVLSYLQKHRNFNFVSLIRCENCQIFIKYFQFSFVVFLISWLLLNIVKLIVDIKKQLLTTFYQVLVVDKCKLRGIQRCSYLQLRFV